MIYLSEKDIRTLPFTWDDTIKVISDAVKCISTNDFVQPVKPYLRYLNQKNRIIAMPAYVGGNTLQAGLKWIASFPENINKGISRAHCVIILNKFDSGVPICIINSSSISSIRTASVSGFMLKQFLKYRQIENIKIGIIGLGPVGYHHILMCNNILQDKLSCLMLYDLKKVEIQKIPKELHNKISIVSSWEKAYLDADIFITCTVSKYRYIDKKPKSGSLHLNVSLRDYKSDVFTWFKDSIIVDSWEEVCRENTDIEKLHFEYGLQKNDVSFMQDFLTEDYISSIEKDQPIMFNPMGMAVFDIAIANFFLKLAEEYQKGIVLD